MLVTLFLLFLYGCLQINYTFYHKWYSNNKVWGMILKMISDSSVFTYYLQIANSIIGRLCGFTRATLFFEYHGCSLFICLVLRYFLHHIAWDFHVLTEWDMTNLGMNAWMCNVSQWNVLKCFSTWLVLYLIPVALSACCHLLSFFLFIFFFIWLVYHV